MADCPVSAAGMSRTCASTQFDVHDQPLPWLLSTRLLSRTVDPSIVADCAHRRPAVPVRCTSERVLPALITGTFECTDGVRGVAVWASVGTVVCWNRHTCGLHVVVASGMCTVTPGRLQQQPTRARLISALAPVTPLHINRSVQVAHAANHAIS
jgi:hypothetical protein